MRLSTLLISSVLCFAFIWQICFFIFIPITPLIGDAKQYRDASHALLCVMGDDNLRSTLLSKLHRYPIGPDQQKRYQEWIQEARLLFIRGPLYPAYLSLFFVFQPDCLAAVRVSQAILVCIVIFLIYLTATRLGGSSVGMASLIIAAIYPVWAIMSSRMLAENLCVVLITLLCYLLLNTDRIRLSLVTGLVCGALALTKPALFCLIPVTIFITYLIHTAKPTPRYLVRHASALLIGIAISLAPLFISATLYFHKPALYNTSCQHWAHYQHNCLEDDGFVAEAPPLINQLLISVMRERGYSPDKWVKINEAPADVYLLATNRSMLKHPVEHFVLAARKFYRAWNNPWNGMRLPTLFPHDLQCLIHRAIVLCAVIGLPISFRAFPCNLALLPGILFCSFFYPFTQSQLQYYIIAMPSMIILCSWALVILLNKFISLCKHGRLPYIKLAMVLAVMIILLTLSIGDIYSVVPSAMAARQLLRLIHAVAFLGLAMILYTFYADIPNKAYRMFSSLLLPVIMIAQIYVAPYGAETWHEWECILSKPGQQIRQVFTISPTITKDVQSASLLIDITAARVMPPLIIRVNDRILATFPEGIPFEERLQKYIWAGAYPFHIDHPEQLRDWLRIPLDPEMLKEQHELSVELSIPSNSHSSGSYTIYGDYPLAFSDRIFRGPSLSSSGYDISQEKWEKTADIRMERATPLTHRECLSYFNNGSRWRTDDLSEIHGVQNGQYRIRIMLTTKTGQVIIL